jgi:hypothetical protein
MAVFLENVRQDGPQSGMLGLANCSDEEFFGSLDIQRWSSKVVAFFLCVVSAFANQ